jgi:histidinol-phosphatase (PHP family)
MLTDYHLHLRPDALGAGAERYFTAANARSYREAASARGIAELGVSEHVYRFREALAIWQHPFWRTYANDELGAYCSFVREHTDLRLGLEVDYIPGREARIAALLAEYDFDYVVGSVHFLAGGAVDMEDYSVWSHANADPEEIWRRYFETLGDAAHSGLFDILAHPDLVKVWGQPHRVPSGDLRRFYELALEGIEASGIAVEVSTAGLRKPVCDLYPSADFLRMCLAVEVPVALSSDAHRPEDVGAGYETVIPWLANLGVEELAVFEGRARQLVQLGSEAIESVLE